MKKPDCDFRTCVLGAVIALDNANSTHLEAAIQGRKTMRDVICGNGIEWHDLVSMLNIPFCLPNRMKGLDILLKKTQGLFLPMSLQQESSEKTIVLNLF